jgi:hypothetical protein
MDALFIEAVSQIVEFLDYPDSLMFTSTCREYYQLRYSQMVIEQYKRRMANIYKICHARDLEDHKYYYTGTSHKYYCGKCSCIVYKRRINRHVHGCNDNRPMKVCEYNKPHTGICDCPYYRQYIVDGL